MNTLERTNYHRYEEKPWVDIPSTPATGEYTRQCARQLERWVEIRDRDHYESEPHQSLVDRYPRISMAVLVAIALGVLWRAYERFK